MMSLKYYLSYTSFIRKNTAEIFFNYYDVTNLFDNKKSAMMCTTDYVERNEPSRSYFNIF